MLHIAGFWAIGICAILGTQTHEGILVSKVEKKIAQSVTRESFFILYFYDIVIMLVLAYASQFSLRSLEAHTLWY